MFKFRLYNRPISPHLAVYTPQFSSLFSIWHRITGIILASFFSLGFIFLKILFLTNFYNLFDINFFKIWLFIYIYLIFLLFLCYHILNGLRHLLWDLGFSLNLDFLHFSSLLFFFILFLVLIINLI